MGNIQIAATISRPITNNGGRLPPDSVPIEGMEGGEYGCWPALVVLGLGGAWADGLLRLGVSARCLPSASSVRRRRWARVVFLGFWLDPLPLLCASIRWVSRWGSTGVPPGTATDALTVAVLYLKVFKNELNMFI
jgi:hypothetical protein